jgi:hypothetical protein
VKRSVETLEDEFCGLSDWPDHLFKAMSKLATTANFVAAVTFDWAEISNSNFTLPNKDRS